MKTYSFSIIIPHKDIPEYLVRCLNSIPERDDVQIIVVDDNSKEACTYIERYPELTRPNVEIYFTTEGKGAGYARNVGLEHAKGEWILFADSDDYYITNHLRVLMDMAQQITSKVVVWGVKITTLDKGDIFDFKKNLDTISSLENFDTTLRHVEPWRKMIRRSFIDENNLQFEEVVASNDVRFHLQLMSFVSKEDIVQFNSNVYCWEHRNGSLFHSITLASEKCRLNVGLRANRFSYKHGWGYVVGTNLYLWRIKQISPTMFYLYFLKEFLFLGIVKAIADYAFVCSKEQKRLPFLMRSLWVVASKF